MTELLNGSQVITGGDIEQRGMACFTFARCIIAAADTTRTSKFFVLRMPLFTPPGSGWTPGSSPLLADRRIRLCHIAKPTVTDERAVSSICRIPQSRLGKTPRRCCSKAYDHRRCEEKAGGRCGG